MHFTTNQRLYGSMSFVFLFLIAVEAFLSHVELSKQCPAKPRDIIALILARGGSKGIPYKNLAKISGVSLLGRALRVIHNCDSCFDEIWVSTDNEFIAQEARRFNANVHYRNNHSARDEATSVEAIQEFLSGHLHIENIALIQCTSVFIYEHYLETAVKLFKSKPNVDCVFSVYRSFKLRWKQMSNSTRLKSMNFDPKNRPRRQDWSGELIESGMFYFARRHLIEDQGLLQNDRCEFVEIDEEHVLEIDNPFHLHLANVLVNNSLL